MKGLTSLLTGLVLTLSLVACGPRGETRSVDQIYQGAKERFAAADRSGVNPAVAPQVDQVAKQLEEAVSSRDPVKFAGLSDVLAGIIRNAGYPTRPSMNEAIQQLREIGGLEPDAAQAKLLASRVYHVLAIELETTKFNVKVS